MVFYNRFWKHYNCYNVSKWTEVFEEVGFKVVSYSEYNPMSLATFHDVCVPLSLPSFLARKYLQRWFLFPKLRYLWAPVIYVFVNPIIKLLRKSDKKHTLVFFHLTH